MCLWYSWTNPPPVNYKHKQLKLTLSLKVFFPNRQCDKCISLLVEIYNSLYFTKIATCANQVKEAGDFQDLGIPVCSHRSNRNRVYLLTMPGTWRICWNLYAWEPQRSCTPVITNTRHILLGKNIDFYGYWFFNSGGLNRFYLNSSSLRNKACDVGIDFQVIDRLLHFMNLNTLYFVRFDGPYLLKWWFPRIKGGCLIKIRFLSDAVRKRKVNLLSSPLGINAVEPQP